MSDDYDEIMDSLPPHLRNKVLGELSGEGVRTQRDMHAQDTPNKTVSRPGWWYLAFLLAILWGGVAGIAALVLLFIIPPLGLVAIMLAGAPGALLLIWEPSEPGSAGQT